VTGKMNTIEHGAVNRESENEHTRSNHDRVVEKDGVEAAAAGRSLA